MIPPALIFAVTGGVSTLALIAALFAQFALGMEPCVLCLYQRVPFLVALVLSIAGLALHRHHRAVTALLGLNALAFLVNAGIAAYHSGVERHWWRSAVEGCAVPDMSDKDWMDKLLSAPAGRCDSIPWADPLLGLSMANYNVALCLGLFTLCAMALMFRQFPKHS